MVWDGGGAKFSVELHISDMFLLMNVSCTCFLAPHSRFRDLQIALLSAVYPHRSNSTRRPRADAGGSPIWQMAVWQPCAPANVTPVADMADIYNEKLQFARNQSLAKFESNSAQALIAALIALSHVCTWGLADLASPRLQGPRLHGRS